MNTHITNKTQSFKQYHLLAHAETIRN